MTTPLVLLLLALAAYAAFARRRHSRLKSRCLAAFAQAYASTTPAPSFEMSYSYGEPAFEIGFASEADMAAAADSGASGSFLRAIDDACKNRGRKRRPFKAERSVYFSHPPVPRPDRKIHCCSQMQAQADRADGPGQVISYSPRTDDYGLRRDGAGNALPIAFCPWCGTPLEDTDQTKSRAR